MSTSVGDTLPARLVQTLSAEPSPDNEAVLLLCSVDDQGWPHPAMVGLRELLVVTPSKLRVALYTGTRTLAFLEQRSQATMTHVDESGVVYLKIRATRPPMPLAEIAGYAAVDFDIEQVLVDAADPRREGDVRLLGGIRVARSEPLRIPGLRAALRMRL